MKTKGHWPKGKRRHPEPTSWGEIRSNLTLIGKRRKTRALARKMGVHPDTIFRWRRGVDIPAPKLTYRLRLHVAALLTGG